MSVITRLSFLPALILTLFSLCSCHSDPIPEDVIEANKLEKILYDYHLAQSLAQQSAPDSINYYTRLYQTAVFQKYGITQAEFDHTMQWYESHADKLKKIYEHLSAQLGGDEQSPTSPALLAKNSLTSNDTLNIWHGPSSLLLNSQSTNRFKYTQRADTAIQAGDELQWCFNVDWFYHDGERRVVACAVIHYEGDSTAVMQKFVYTSGPQQANITIGKLKVQHIDCFIYQCTSWADRVRIASITNMRLYRLRSKNKATEENTSDHQFNTDSTQRKLRLNNPQLRLRDSLIKEEKSNETKPHFI